MLGSCAYCVFWVWANFHVYKLCDGFPCLASSFFQVTNRMSIGSSVAAERFG